MSETSSVTTNTSVGVIDVMPPYYIHASDNLGKVYVGELLNESNYGECKTDMSNALFAKNKIGFVDGTMQMPMSGSSDLNHWMRCNAMVIGWLKRAMSKDVRASVRYAKTGKEICVDVEERFEKGSEPRAYELRRMVAHLRQDKQSVPTFYNKLKGYWDEIESIALWPICTCGGYKCDLQKRLAEMKERDEENYNTIKTQILNMNPIPKPSMAYHLES